MATDEPEAVTRARALDIVRRAYETVRFMNVAVMNGNDFKGRSALVARLDAGGGGGRHPARRSARSCRPATVDTFAIMPCTSRSIAALRGGATPWFVRLLRRPDEVADFTDRGRRKMPALMCGADNNYLALTSGRSTPSARPAPRRRSQSDAATAGAAAADAAQPLGAAPLRGPGQSDQLAPGDGGRQLLPRPRGRFPRRVAAHVQGLELREYDNLVVDVDAKAAGARSGGLKGHRLLRVFLPGEPERHSDGDADQGPGLVGSRAADPADHRHEPDRAGAAGMVERAGPGARRPSGQACNAARSPDSRVWNLEDVSAIRSKNYHQASGCEVRSFFETGTAVISPELAEPGELTQGLCSPWQNDYRECSCYYWASARPDYVNVEPTASRAQQAATTGCRRSAPATTCRTTTPTRAWSIYDDLFAALGEAAEVPDRRAATGRNRRASRRRTRNGESRRRPPLHATPRRRASPQAHLVETALGRHLFVADGSRLFDVDAGAVRRARCCDRRRSADRRRRCCSACGLDGPPLIDDTPSGVAATARAVARRRAEVQSRLHVLLRPAGRVRRAGQEHGAGTRPTRAVDLLVARRRARRAPQPRVPRRRAAGQPRVLQAATRRARELAPSAARSSLSRSPPTARC